MLFSHSLKLKVQSKQSKDFANRSFFIVSLAGAAVLLAYLFAGAYHADRCSRVADPLRWCYHAERCSRVADPLPWCYHAERCSRVACLPLRWCLPCREVQPCCLFLMLVLSTMQRVQPYCLFYIYNV